MPIIMRERKSQSFSHSEKRGKPPEGSFTSFTSSPFPISFPVFHHTEISWALIFIQGRKIASRQKIMKIKDYRYNPLLVSYATHILLFFLLYQVLHFIHVLDAPIYEFFIHCVYCSGLLLPICLSILNTCTVCMMFFGSIRFHGDSAFVIEAWLVCLHVLERFSLGREWIFV